MKRVIAAIAIGTLLLAGFVTWQGIRKDQRSLRFAVQQKADDLSFAWKASPIVSVGVLCDDQPGQIPGVAMDRISSRAIAELIPLGCEIKGAEVTSYLLTPLEDFAEITLPRHDGATVRAEVDLDERAGRVTIHLAAEEPALFGLVRLMAEGVSEGNALRAHNVEEDLHKAVADVVARSENRFTKQQRVVAGDVEQGYDPKPQEVVRETPVQKPEKPDQGDDDELQPAKPIVAQPESQLKPAAEAPPAPPTADEVFLPDAFSEFGAGPQP